jgi:CRP-like cAMP-binding protein
MQAVKAIFQKQGKLVTFRADEIIFSRGTDPRGVYFIKSGRVLLHSSSLGGREVGFDILNSGEIFGFATFGSSKSILDATALTDCDLLYFTRHDFERAIKNNVGAAIETLYHLSERLKRRTRQAEGLALYNLRRRLARWVVAQALQQHGLLDSQKAVHLELSQKLMAAMAGVSRETLNRQFNEWIKAGIVAIDGKKLRILKQDELIAIAGPADDVP